MIDTVAGAAADLWEDVRLPHDWAISRGPDKGKYMKNYGHYPLPGTYWYRKSFELPDADKHKRVVLAFEGAMQDATVYLNGRQVRCFVPTFNEPLELSVEGAGELVALGSGNPTDFTPMQRGRTYTAFNGKCLAIVRGLDGQPGTITVRVKGASGPAEPAGFKGATIKITVK